MLSSLTMFRVCLSDCLYCRSIEGVEPTEFAIIRNNLSQDINQEEILEGGLHWVGLFYSLIHFPSTHKSIEFSDD